MDSKDQKINELKQIINSAEESLEEAKRALRELTGEELKPVTSNKFNGNVLSSVKVTDDGQVIEGVFNGENMLGPEGKTFPVPANYASKSKLVEGDRLKLTIAEDGSFIFKQIGPIERKNLVGTLAFENNAYHVTAENKTYNVLYASVSYFKAKPGDKVTIVVPAPGESDWAALENIIHDVAETPAKEVASDPLPANDAIIKDFFADESASTQAVAAMPVLGSVTQENTDSVPKEDSVEPMIHEKVVPVPESNPLSDLPDFPDLDKIPTPVAAVAEKAATAVAAEAPATNNFFDSLESTASAEPVTVPGASVPAAQDSPVATLGQLPDLPAAEAKDLDI